MARHERPHGTRARFDQGCRCLKCKLVKSTAVAQRKASILAGTYQYNGIVDAAPARNHLLKLQRRGVGLRSVVEVTGMSKWKLADIRSGRRLRIRAETVRRILAVPLDALADGAQVPADETRRIVRRLQREGFTQAELARRLGRKGRFNLRSQRFVFARTEMQVKKFYDEVMAA